MLKPGPGVTYVTVLLAVLFLFIPSCKAQGQTTEITGKVRLVAKLAPWHWTKLTGATIAAGAFDIETTHAVRRSLVGNEQAREVDILAQPFAFHRDREYPALILGYAALGAVANHMRHSDGFSRHIWWVPQTFAIGVHIFCGVQNIQHAERS